MSESKPLVFMGSSEEDLAAFPRAVKRVIGYALRAAQNGTRHPDAKPLRGYRGASVLEIVEDYSSNTYRAVYTVRLSRRVYVLHAFQKKSKQGIKTPRHEMDLIDDRLKDAEKVHQEWLAERGEA